MGKLLPKTELVRLDRIIGASAFDTEEAIELDNAILTAISDGDVDYESHKPMDGAQSLFFSAWWLEGEVNNGGFDQFFLNKGPLTARKAQQFCRERGLSAVATLVDRAIKAVGSKAMSGSDAMAARLCEEDELLAETLGDLDGLFFALNPYPPFIEARFRFVRDNANSFFR